MTIPSSCRHAHLHHRTGNGNPLDGQQVVERKVQPHAKHQQHDADLRQLGGHVDVGHKTWRGRTNQNARQQVTHQRRHLDPLRDESEDQGDAETGGNGSDQRNVGFHSVSLVEQSATHGPPNSWFGWGSLSRLGQSFPISLHGQIGSDGISVFGRG
jgi:hypothetical protein